MIYEIYFQNFNPPEPETHFVSFLKQSVNILGKISEQVLWSVMEKERNWH